MAMVDASHPHYAWIQQESHISASQEQLLENVSGWDDFKTEQSWTPSQLQLGVEQRPSQHPGLLRLGCDSEDADLGMSSGQENAFGSFAVDETVELASPSDFEEETPAGDSGNVELEINRSGLFGSSESLSLCNVLFPDLHGDRYITQSGMGLTASEEVIRGFDLEGNKENASSILARSSVPTKDKEGKGHDNRKFRMVGSSVRVGEFAPACSKLGSKHSLPNNSSKDSDLSYPRVERRMRDSKDLKLCNSKTEDLDPAKLQRNDKDGNEHDLPPETSLQRVRDKDIGEMTGARFVTYRKTRAGSKISL
eukprot:c29159_g2_i1 orf=1033-1959(-)